MFTTRQWQSKTALLMALVVSAAAGAPIASAAPKEPLFSRQTTGQLLQPRRQVVIPSGTVIPVRYDKAEKILVTPEETAPLTLQVASDVTSSTGTILIPAGSQVIGELRPASGGSQFFAKEIIMRRNTRMLINARSQVVRKTERIDKGVDAGQVLKGAAVGAAAAAVISAVTGDRAIATEEVLGGAGVGALGGLIFGRKKATVISIDPNNDLDLTLRSQLALR